MLKCKLMTDIIKKPGLVQPTPTKFCQKNNNKSIFNCRTVFEHEPNITNLNIWLVFVFGELPEPNLRFRFRFEHMTPEHEPNRTLASLFSSETSRIDRELDWPKSSSVQVQPLFGQT